MPKPTPMGKKQTGRRKKPSKMAKGYAKGSTKKGVKTKTMTLAQAKKVLKMNNMKAVKI